MSARPWIWGLVAFLACLVVFAGVGMLVAQPSIPPVDAAVSASIRDLASPGLDALMRATTLLGSTVILASVGGLAALLLASRGHRALALFVLLALVGTLVLNDGLKQLFERARPRFDWAEARLDFGFPSGHAMNSFVVYVSLGSVAWRLWGRRIGIAAIAAALGIAVAVGTTRVYLGVHWFTDVVGGYLAGAVWLLVAAALIALVVPVGQSGAPGAMGPAQDARTHPPP